MMDLGWPMLSMVNANRFISGGAIPLVLLAYAVFIWIDHVHAAREYEHESDVKLHMQNFKNGRSVDALVFGGSNAVYSLSAEYLSYNTGLKWYNASLVGELDTSDRYNNFVRELSARIDRTKVRYVVYSSAFPYLPGLIDFQAKKGLKGIGIKPSGSVLGYIVRYISGDVPTYDSLRTNSFGDLVFESVKCAFNKKSPKHQREEEDTSAAFLVDKAIFFASIFPNASILIVLPSEYYGVASFDDSIFEQDLRTKFYGLLRQKYHFEGMAKIIFQPPYSSITQVCDNESHADEDGRVWRTRNLIESIRATVAYQR
jgi:hypothetical protein